MFFPRQNLDMLQLKNMIIKILFIPFNCEKQYHKTSLLAVLNYSLMLRVPLVYTRNVPIGMSEHHAKECDSIEQIVL